MTRVPGELAPVGVEEELQYVGLVLEDQLLDHLATPEGATAIWKERLDPDVIPDSDEGIRECLKFVIRYMDDHRVPPGPAVIAEEIGYQDFNVPQTPVKYVIDKLRERYQKKNLRKIITKMGRMSVEPAESMQYGLDELMQLKLATAERGSDLSSDDFSGVIDDYNVRIDNPSESLSFGYTAIDQHLGGLRLGELTVILARPKRYKSWQLVKSAAQNVLDGHTVFFETMELTTQEMRDRFTCMVAGISWYRFQHKLLSTDDLAQLDHTIRQLMEWEAKCHFHRSKPGERNVHNVVEHALDRGAEVLYIDQLSWFDGAKDEGSWRVVGQIMEELKDAAQHFPVYMAAQYNRAAAMEDGIADLAKIGLSDYIGQTADLLLGMYASRDMIENKLLHLGVVESRSFEPCTWELKIDLSADCNFKVLNIL